MTWVKVVFAMECAATDDDDEVLTCPHCPCPGPHQDDEYEYVERPDGLYARKLP